MKAKQREVLPMFDSGMPHRPVVRTSVLAWEAHGGFTGRKKLVFDVLREYLSPPTSAELATRLPDRAGRDDTAILLLARRGLSDLLAVGAVMHGPERRCVITGEMCKTWLVPTR